ATVSPFRTLLQRSTETWRRSKHERSGCWRNCARVDRPRCTGSANGCIPRHCGGGSGRSSRRCRATSICCSRAGRPCVKTGCSRPADGSTGCRCGPARARCAPKPGGKHVDLDAYNAAWLKAWSDKDVERLLEFYHPDVVYKDGQTVTGLK